jgi:hypothetical protein
MGALPPLARLAPLSPPRNVASYNLDIFEQPARSAIFIELLE